MIILDAFKSIVLFSVFICQISFAQNIDSKEFDKCYYRIKSSNFNSNQKDLNFLDDIIKDKKIVVLGEHFHADGNTLKLKSRIIKYLIDVHDFEVVFYELPYEDVNRINYLKKSELDFIIFLSQIFILPSINISDLIKYFGEKNNNGFNIEGIDLGMNRTCFGSCYYYDSLFATYNNVQLATDWKIFGKIYWSSLTKDTINETKVFETFTAKKNSLLTLFKENGKIGSDSIRIRLSMLINNMFYQVLDMKDRRVMGEKYWFRSNLRDSMMFVNFKTLYDNFYPDKKVIINISNFHASRNLNIITNENFTEPFGNYLSKYYKNKAFTIGSISYSGKVGTPEKSYKIPTHKKNSMEQAIKNKGAEYSFFDLSKYNYQEKIWMYSIGVNMFQTQYWNKVFDGLIYNEHSIEDVHKRIDIKEKFPTVTDSKNLYLIENIYQVGFKNAELIFNDPSYKVLKPF